MSKHDYMGPGTTIGILGGGQLGRMTALAGRRLGYKFVCYEPEKGSPASSVCDAAFHAAWGDHAALEGFAQHSDVITYEFENIPAHALERVGKERAPMLPRPEVLSICQSREREKSFLKAHGLPHARFAIVGSAEELAVAWNALPNKHGVLKTTEWGYDGKGQQFLLPGETGNAAKIWEGFEGKNAVLEEFVDYELELSVVCARSTHGEVACFPPAENRHRRHILETSLVPGTFSPEIAEEARALAIRVTEALDVVGLLAVEMFLTRDGRLVINELAPRSHNSGHYTWDACLTSQFEQHLRAICGLPLGSVELLRPVVMINLLGDLWNAGEPDWPGLLREYPGLRLHLYGKAQARPRRKMGHACLLGEPGEDAAALRAKGEKILAKLSENAGV
jgi:5-(carboxyamino)imidazole ribonucleotide synthase